MEEEKEKKGKVTIARHGGTTGSHFKFLRILGARFLTPTSYFNIIMLILNYQYT